MIGWIPVPLLGMAAAEMVDEEDGVVCRVGGPTGQAFAAFVKVLEGPLLVREEAELETSFGGTPRPLMPASTSKSAEPCCSSRKETLRPMDVLPAHSAVPDEEATVVAMCRLAPVPASGSVAASVMRLASLADATCASHSGDTMWIGLAPGSPKK